MLQKIMQIQSTLYAKLYIKKKNITENEESNFFKRYYTFVRKQCWRDLGVNYAENRSTRVLSLELYIFTLN